MSDETERQQPIRRVRVIRPGGAQGRSGRYGQRRNSDGPSGPDLKPYLVGGIVSAAVTALLIVAWLLATPDNPFSSKAAATPLPVINNRINPQDVPTQVGTAAPGGLATQLPAVPTG